VKGKAALTEGGSGRGGRLLAVVVFWAGTGLLVPTCFFTAGFLDVSLLPPVVGAVVQILPSPSSWSKSALLLLDRPLVVLPRDMSSCVNCATVKLEVTLAALSKPDASGEVDQIEFSPSRSKNQLLGLLEVPLVSGRR
jgi:hypothetical protein